MLYSFGHVNFFFFFSFFFFFFATILSGPYLWNRYLQRLQIECAAWSYGLVVHYCLPSNSLCYFYLFFFFAKILSGSYLWNHYSQRLQIEGAAWFCGLVLHYCLPSNSLHYWTKVRGIAPRSHTGRPRTCLDIIIISDPRRVCYMVLPMFIFFFFFFPFFSVTFVRAISLEPLLAETPN